MVKLTNLIVHDNLLNIYIHRLAIHVRYFVFDAFLLLSSSCFKTSFVWGNCVGDDVVLYLLSPCRLLTCHYSHSSTSQQILFSFPVQIIQHQKICGSTPAEVCAVEDLFDCLSWQLLP